MKKYITARLLWFYFAFAYNRKQFSYWQGTGMWFSLGFMIYVVLFNMYHFHFQICYEQRPNPDQLGFICFIYQKHKKWETTRSTPERIDSLARSISRIYKLGVCVGIRSSHLPEAWRWFRTSCSRYTTYEEITSEF